LERIEKNQQITIQERFKRLPNVTRFFKHLAENTDIQMAGHIFDII
jgi:hypothetical protein